LKITFAFPYAEIVFCLVGRQQGQVEEGAGMEEQKETLERKEGKKNLQEFKKSDSIKVQ